MGWGSEEEVTRQSLDDPVLASLANAKERKVKRWDPVTKEAPAQHMVMDVDKAKRVQERFSKVQAAAVMAAQAEDSNGRGHPSLSELRQRRQERAEKEKAEKERLARERADVVHAEKEAGGVGLRNDETGAEVTSPTMMPPTRDRRHSYESSGIASSVTAQRLERSRARTPRSSGAPGSHDVRTAPMPDRSLGELVTERNKLLNAGSWAEAEILIAALLKRQRAEQGDRHIDTLVSLEMYGLLLTALCRFSEALPVTLEVVHARREMLGEEHKRTETVVANLDHLQQLAAQAEAEGNNKDGDGETGKVDAEAAAKLRRTVTEATFATEADAFFREFMKNVKAEEAAAKAEAEALEAAKKEEEEAEAIAAQAEAMRLALSLASGGSSKYIPRRRSV
jgi:hypothetical protein